HSVSYPTSFQYLLHFLSDYPSSYLRRLFDPLVLQRIGKTPEAFSIFLEFMGAQLQQEKLSTQEALQLFLLKLDNKPVFYEAIKESPKAFQSALRFARTYFTPSQIEKLTEAYGDAILTHYIGNPAHLRTILYSLSDHPLDRQVLKSFLMIAASKNVESFQLVVDYIKDRYGKKILRRIFVSEWPHLQAPSHLRTAIKQIMATSLAIDYHSQMVLERVALFSTVEGEERIFKPLLARIDLNADNWKDALLKPLFSNYPRLVEVLSSPRLLGDPENWDEFFLLRLMRLREGELRHLEKWLKRMENPEKVIRWITLSDDEKWRKAVLASLGAKDILEKAANRYLGGEVVERLKKNYPEIWEELVEWTIAARDLHPGAQRMLELALLSKKEYKKARYAHTSLPSFWKEDWEKQVDHTIVLQSQIISFLKFLKEQKWLRKDPTLKPILAQLVYLHEKRYESAHRILYLVEKLLLPALYYPQKAMPYVRRLKSLLPPRFTIEITDDIEAFYEIHQRGKGEIINAVGEDEFKLSFAGAVANPWIKVALMKDEEGNIIGGAFLYLLQKDGKPFVYVDKFRGKAETRPLFHFHLKQLFRNEWKVPFSLEKEVKDVDFYRPFYAPFYVSVGIHYIKKGLAYPI
ncbi:MAG: hypothetical protein GXN92_00500, partial [Candidatus Micrarchaeota archaeon]|nr:hypothetical protein [Candidatus Micrarchaeota archaeon]